MSRGLATFVAPVVRPVIRLATRSYVVGDHAADALRFAGSLAEVGITATCGYWDARTDDAARILAEHRQILEAAAASPDLDLRLSLKLPPLAEHPDAVRALIESARAQGTRVILDAHAPETADAVFALVDEIGGEGLGIAIPGRWRRSLEDVDHAIERGAHVRVVKGQWADPGAPDLDLRAGFLAIIDRCSGKGAEVSVASHDPVVVEAAFERLASAGTPHELELLFPLPSDRVRALAKARAVATRLYLPYGSAWLPYSLGKAMHRPRTLWWLARDLVRTRRSSLPRPSRAQTPKE